MSTPVLKMRYYFIARYTVIPQVKLGLPVLSHVSLDYWSICLRKRLKSRRIISLV